MASSATAFLRCVIRGVGRRLRRAGLLPGRDGWQSPRARPIVVTRQPPAIDEPMRALRATAQRVPLAESMDVELFEELNRQYAAHPLVPAPPAYDHGTLVDRATARVASIHGRIDLADKDVLVFGCGNGYEVWFLADAYGSRATGIDIVEHGSWAGLAGPDRSFVMADLATEQPFAAGSFDRIVSINVFEHVTHPKAILAELYRILRPGGVAWITANLYRGPKASHRYRQIHFPWPHLLFADDVVREFYRRRGQPDLTSEWVNKLTWEQYRDHMVGLGFRIRRLKFLETPIDEALYQRFEWILGRYPRADLARDFFQVILEKPR